MPTFDMVCVGTGGGPDETNLSAYLIKPSSSAWKDGIFALEAGSGPGALNQILKRQPDLFASAPDNFARYSPAEIYSFVRCYLITHAHLDHVNSLVISAGSLKGPRKRVYAAEETLKDLECVFADRLWPNLASWKEQDEAFKLLYTTLNTDAVYTSVYPNVSVRMVAVNHGINGTGTYESCAFFVRHDPSESEFLFFGDVEPDTVAQTPRNIDVWRIAAPKIAAAKLSVIFIECSWPSGRPDNLLYGHLTPEHLAAELDTLASEVGKVRDSRLGASSTPAPISGSRSRPSRKKRKTSHSSKSTPNQTRTPTPALAPPVRASALRGLRVYVMHCKDTMDCAPDQPVQRVIADQVRSLVEQKGLGAEILAAEQGMRIEI